MSANLVEKVVVDVTRGDCLDPNRKAGKSNTGTYFICSVNNFDEYESYFKEGQVYKIDLVRVELYKTLFKEYCIEYNEQYIGKMTNFDGYINYLLSLKENPTVNISLRKNDARVFMRFDDNSNIIVNAFRNLLYEDISRLVLYKKSDCILIYPEINDEYVHIKAADNNGLEIDE